MIGRFGGNRLGTAAMLVFTLASSVAYAQTTISVPFQGGFIGTYGGNPVATSVTPLSLLDVTSVAFSQVSESGYFSAQGNDIPGTLTLEYNDDQNQRQTLMLTGSIVWRVTAQGSLIGLGFVADSTDILGVTPEAAEGSRLTIVLKAAEGLEPSGGSISGNAANVLTELNGYLTDNLRSGTFDLNGDGFIDTVDQNGNIVFGTDPNADPGTDTDDDPGTDPNTDPGDLTAERPQSVLERVLASIDGATNLARVNGTFVNIAENIGGVNGEGINGSITNIVNGVTLSTQSIVSGVVAVEYGT